MNINTGELFRMTPEMEKEFAKELMERDSPIKPVPNDFLEEVERLLAGEDSTCVDMKKASPLVDWAKSQRNQPNPNGNRKHRRKMAKQSRKKNRG